MATIFSGTAVSDALRLRLLPQATFLRLKGVTPTLAILRLGARAGDLSYERGAIKCAQTLGIQVERVALPANCTREELIEAIRRVNEDQRIHGCLLLRPLPPELEEAACQTLRPEKDVDGITAGAMARIFTGRGVGYPPCTAQACLEILDHYGCTLEGQRAVVVGRSLVVGRPLAMLLMARNATVTLCHSHTQRLAEECRRADLLAVAVGKPGFISSNHLSRGQIILDAGIHVTCQGKLHGDVDFPAAEPLAGAITPVPGGVGSVTAALLASHVIDAAAQANGLTLPS